MLGQEVLSSMAMREGEDGSRSCRSVRRFWTAATRASTSVLFAAAMLIMNGLDGWGCVDRILLTESR